MKLTCLLLCFIINSFERTQSLSVDGECGVLNTDLITDLSLVTASEGFPWIARLGYRYTFEPSEIGYKCQGVLISKRAVLTANHCLQQLEQELVSVALGYIDPADKLTCERNPECAELPQIFNIEKIISHPNYDGRTNRNDIGMVLLEKAVPYGKYIQPICLPSADVTKDKLMAKQLYVAGYPLTRGSSSDEESKIKSHAEIVSPEVCESVYSQKLTLKLESEQICVMIDDKSKYLSGAPLMNVEAEENKPKQFYLVGLVSAGIRHGKTRLPDIFVNVTTHLDWIKGNLQ